jgi:predicted hotdog family 3-hydroxylacyl-ACP dehydratase
MKNHEVAKELVKSFKKRKMNEADTRHQIIDRLLHEVLGWPHSSVKCEEHVHPGYADYVLRDATDRVVLLIEAKREGKYFVLPKKATRGSASRRVVRLGTLVTNKDVKEAVKQAAAYCPVLGCEYACITNGHEYVVFQAFIRGKDYLDGHAAVIPNLSYFSTEFTEAYNFLGYSGITTGRTLQLHFESSGNSPRELFYPKTGITHYDAPVQKNRHARYLEPLANRYFGEIRTSDSRMMKECFVFARGTRELEDEMKGRLSDRLTPFLELDGGNEIAEVRKGGRLVERIARSLDNQRAGDVVILYGGKGSGKSTFLRRLFYYDPPEAFRAHAFPIVIDCLQVPQEEHALSDHIWNTLIAALDLDGLLKGPIENLIRLYEDRFEVAQNQDLSGGCGTRSDHDHAAAFSTFAI